jgi:hypothetical protein
MTASCISVYCKRLLAEQVDYDLKARDHDNLGQHAVSTTKRCNGWGDRASEARGHVPKGLLRCDARMNNHHFKSRI